MSMVKRYTSEGDGWVLNPDTTFPLTILGVDEQLALKLKDLLDQTETVHPRGLFNSVAAMIAQTGLRCKEIEDYVANFRESFAEDAELDVAPYCDLDSLFNGKRLDLTFGASVVARYGFDNLRFYCRYLKMIDMPRPIPISHRDRERFEELTRVGLATIGPPITKAGKYGDSFKLNTLKESINLDDLGSWLKLCTTIAELITLTYYSSSVPTTQIALYNNYPDIVGYEVAATGDDCTCPFCTRMAGKKYPARSRPKVPFHLGCRCVVQEIWR
ncbi:MAG: hypothetical protein ABSB91_03830 [Sedimentisphaerales bacterium]